MKQRLIILVIAVLLCSTMNLSAQEERGGKITIEMTKEINGERKTFKGEYESTEEMKADPNYQEFAGQDENFDFGFNGEPNEGDMIFELNQLKGLANLFQFFGDEDDHDKFIFKHFDGDSLEEAFHFHMDNLDIGDLSEKMKELGIELEVLLNNFNDGDRDHRVKIITLKKVSISEVLGNEFGKKGAVKDSNKLVLDGLTFSPNPSSNGRFKVKFKVPEEKELTIRVYNLEGKEVFNRYFERFGGIYSETIDLSRQKEGIFLLEITQEGKRLTKKIAIN